MQVLPPSPPPPPSDSGSSTNVGAIVGGTVGGVALVAAALGTYVYVKKRKGAGGEAYGAETGSKKGAMFSGNAAFEDEVRVAHYTATLFPALSWAWPG